MLDQEILNNLGISCTDYEERAKYWHKKSLVSQEDLCMAPKGIESLVRVVPGSEPLIERGEKVWVGAFIGGSPNILGMFGLDAGIVRGKDIRELSVMTFYTDIGIRIWAASHDPDSFMDVAAYTSFCYEHKRPLLLGGKLVGDEGVPEFKAEYFYEEGPFNTYEHHLLIPLQKHFLEKDHSILRKNLRNGTVKDEGYWRSLSHSFLSEMRNKAVGSDVLAYIRLGCVPLIERGEAIWRGAYLGFSAGWLDAGGIVGHDTREISTITFYTEDGIRVWAESEDSDDFMDTASYFSFCYGLKKGVLVGGGVTTQKNEVPEIKVEYVKLEGPNKSSEEELLTVTR